MAEKGRVKVKNGEVPFIKFGFGKKAFVILPGLSLDVVSESAEAIEFAYAIFKKEYTVYLIDRNLYPKTGYTVSDIADDTAEVMEKLRIGKAYIFGASLGSMVAQSLALNYPEKVCKLALGSTLSRPNQTFLSVLNEWVKLAENNDISALTAIMNAKIYSPETLEKHKEFFASFTVNASEENIARFIVYANAAKNFNVYSSLNEISAETLVISAQNDAATTVKAARETAGKLKCAYYEYKNFGHAVYDEAPDYKNRILAFFKNE